ncbi:CLUMA_CG003535, isoform A [Clunio marinus]|uniref:CLUMA_CG003535, isoform A n=1 Tax=Clunio marinus TaxID=568069 RepID=A0A1J1HR51_9DIPT|nr:CLUMA_CG003535, isoform A [Clunio marinus]
MAAISLGQLRNEFNDFDQIYTYCEAKRKYVKKDGSKTAKAFVKFISNELQNQFPEYDENKKGWITRNTRCSGKKGDLDNHDDDERLVKQLDTHLALINTARMTFHLLAKEGRFQ